MKQAPPQDNRIGRLDKRPSMGASSLSTLKNNLFLKICLPHLGSDPL